uniref:Uncharacterized protein n=1 Tax=Rhodopseudomonas palustris (strain DX-1) TaxID=652103 RepID=E6VF79_RHOPX
MMLTKRSFVVGALGGLAMMGLPIETRAEGASGGTLR